ncbi:MAG: hypothetical protein JWP14_3382 [Frankiales bacterium]|nr:hypothetical protein [Frankiales bacterium]
MARSQFTPQPMGTGVSVRFDTAADTNTPADVTTLTGVPLPASGAKGDLLTGALAPILGPDSVTTLYQKKLNYRGAVTGDPVELTGVAPSEPSETGTSVAQTVVAKTAAYAAVNGDVVLADASGADFTVTLPVPASGAKVTVKNVGATGTVTVDQHAAEDIDGAASYTLATQYLSRDFLSDGTDWWVV